MYADFFNIETADGEVPDPDLARDIKIRVELELSYKDSHIFIADKYSTLKWENGPQAQYCAPSVELQSKRN